MYFKSIEAANRLLDCESPFNHRIDLKNKMDQTCIKLTCFIYFTRVAIKKETSRGTTVMKLLFQNSLPSYRSCGTWRGAGELHWKKLTNNDGKDFPYIYIYTLHEMGDFLWDPLLPSLKLTAKAPEMDGWFT